MKRFIHRWHLADERAARHAWVANLIGLPVRDGDQIRTQRATLSTYTIAYDGRLTFVSYDIETNGSLQFWGGFAGL